MIPLGRDIESVVPLLSYLKTAALWDEEAVATAAFGSKVFWKMSSLRCAGVHPPWNGPR
jgi:hypothetical protein